MGLVIYKHDHVWKGQWKSWKAKKKKKKKKEKKAKLTFKRDKIV